MASSPRCPSCGYRALRLRKRTRDFRCSRCRNVFPIAVSADGQIPTDESERLVALSVVLSEIDAAACAAYERHAPPAALISILSVVTAVIVFAMTLQSWAWYAAAGAAVGTAAFAFCVLLLRHMRSVAKEHPLLFRVLTVRLASGRTVHSSQEVLQVCVEAVRRYLPEAESRELLSRLDEARRKLQGRLDT